MMRKKLILTLSICSIISFNSYAFNESPTTTDKVQSENTQTNKISPINMQNLHKLAISLKNENFSNKILAYSDYFIGKPYDTELGTNLIIWDKNRDKNELINLETFDCFSYIEMVIALAEIKEPNVDPVKFKEQLAEALAKIMFPSDDISYVNRNHFMDEWLKNNSKYLTMENVFANLPYAKVKTAMINKAGLLETQINNYIKDNVSRDECFSFGEKYNQIKSIKPFKSDISYISFTDFLEHKQELTKQFAGKIYLMVMTMDNPKLLELTKSEHNIAHVGFVFTKNDKLYFRHATPIGPKEIVEVSLEEYATGKKESKIFTGFTLFSLEQKDNPPNK
ncbi:MULTISPECIES: N-acetylmuramoyl-L-alanine amidase-like domain-containing protein [unclassified Rickettsia]|uniref:N-acetylmuramoyl-L-alanine amidase-like domain-containing protein n=1 Tax=unclassified Rickettsia TaxID=114295 RepID=UPI003132E96B